MNILTFDIEEWYIEKSLHGGRVEKYRQFDEMLERLLALLSEHDLKATCFCLGKLVEQRPDVVRHLHAAGHEMVEHPDNHYWTYVNLLEYDRVGEIIKEAVEKVGHINGLLNCAGISTTNLFKLTKPEELDKFFHVNVYTGYFLTQELYDINKWDVNLSNYDLL